MAGMDSVVFPIRNSFFIVVWTLPLILLIFFWRVFVIIFVCVSVRDEPIYYNGV